MLIRFLVTLVLLLIPFSFAQQELWETPQGRERVFNALVDTFKDNYWDADYRDWDAWGERYKEDALEAETRSQFETVLRRMINSLDDDHSRWVGRLELPTLPQGDTDFDTRDPLGLGFQHRLLDNVGIVIERVYAGTPAAEAGLQRGDVIVTVNAQNFVSSGNTSSGRILREAIDTGEVQLDVSRKNARLRFTLTPERINFDRVSSLPQGYMLDEQTAYIFLPSFDSAGVAQLMHDLIRDLQAEGAEAIVWDLRDNPGGRLGELGLILGAFLEGEWVTAISQEEPIWTARYRRTGNQGINALVTPEGRAISSERISNPVNFNGNLAIIVSRTNSSAGEVGPLVLKELDRATIIGEKTDGNVEAIRTFDLPDGSIVYVAIANLQGIQGTDFTTGLEPDVLVGGSSLDDLARGFDAPVAEALKALKDLPFTPGKFF